MNALSALELKNSSFKKRQAIRRLSLKEIFRGVKSHPANAKAPKYLLGEDEGA